MQVINEGLRLGNIVKFVHRKAIKDVKFRGTYGYIMQKEGSLCNYTCMIFSYHVVAGDTFLIWIYITFLAQVILFHQVGMSYPFSPPFILIRLSMPILSTLILGGGR